MNMDSGLEVLKKLDAFFDTSDKWTRNAEARTSLGRSCSPHADNAVKWCALGACAKMGVPWPTILRIEADLGKGLPEINDSSTSFTEFKQRLSDGIKLMMEAARGRS